MNEKKTNINGRIHLKICLPKISASRKRRILYDKNSLRFLRTRLILKIYIYTYIKFNI